MTSKPSILLLGGSKQQVVAIECAKRLGYRTVLADYLSDNPGQYTADVFYQESTTDRDAMLALAKREGVQGVLAYSSDPAAPTAAYVAEQLGLPTNPLASVETLSVKHLFRRHLAEHGFPCPKSLAVDADITPAELVRLAQGMRLPLVLKPSDSSGSKGITILDTLDERALAHALDHANCFSRNGVLVFEEYIRAGFPRVIGGDVFVVNGEVRFWGLMSCLRDEGLGGLVPVGERNPSGLTESQLAAVKAQIQKLVTSLDIRFGELNVEIILGDDDKPYFLELGARAGGNMIPVQLADISGIDLVEANVRCAMGDYSMPVNFDGNEVAICTYVPHVAAEGVFDHIAYSDQIAPHVYREVMYVEPGDHVCRFDGANRALGILFLRFDSAEQLERMMDRASAHISVMLCEENA